MLGFTSLDVPDHRRNGFRCFTGKIILIVAFSTLIVVQSLTIMLFGDGSTGEKEHSERHDTDCFTHIFIPLVNPEHTLASGSGMSISNNRNMKRERRRRPTETDTS